MTALVGLEIILRCINTIQGSIAKNQREKTIAFEGNLGQVSISLVALEDMVKKLLLEFKDFKEIKPQITASKKGLQVVLKVVLSSYVNIPEFTLRIAKNDEIIHTERAITGLVNKQTPVFSEDIMMITFRPRWNVPNSIKVRELWPSLARGGRYFQRQGLRLSRNGRVIARATK